MPGDQKGAAKNPHDKLPAQKPDRDEKPKTKNPLVGQHELKKDKEGKVKTDVLGGGKPDVGPTPGKP